jgi:hypothetical protein
VMVGESAPARPWPAGGGGGGVGGGVDIPVSAGGSSGSKLQARGGDGV